MTPLGTCRHCSCPVVADPLRRAVACDLAGRWVHCDCSTRARAGGVAGEPAAPLLPDRQLSLLDEGAA